MPRRRAIIITVAATIISLIPCIPSANVEVSYSNNAVTCITKWSYANNGAYLLLLILKCSYTAFIPVTIMIGSYTKLYLVAREHAKRRTKLQMGKDFNNVRKTPIHMSANIRALKMCLFIMGTFIIAWIPYTSLSIFEYTSKRDAPAFVVFFTYWTCLCNSWCDVVIYLFMSREFRSTAMKLVCRRRSKYSPPSSGHTR